MSLLCSQQRVVPPPHWCSRRFRPMTQSSTGTHAHVPGLVDILGVGSPEVGSPEVGSPEVGSPEVGSPEVGSLGTPDLGIHSSDFGIPGEDSLVDSPVMVDIPVVEDSLVVEVGIPPVLGRGMVEEVLRNTNAQSMAPAHHI